MATNVDENYHQTWGIPSVLSLKSKNLNSPTINPLNNGALSQQKQPYKGLSKRPSKRQAKGLTKVPIKSPILATIKEPMTKGPAKPPAKLPAKPPAKLPAKPPAKLPAKPPSILLSHKPKVELKFPVPFVNDLKKVVLDEQTEDLVRYLRKPDPLVTRNRERSASNFTLLTPISSIYFPESPSVLLDRIDKTLFEGSSMLEPRLVKSFKKYNAPKLLPDDAPLNLAVLGKPLPGYDIGPLYENKYSSSPIDAEDDCEKKCLAILYSELNKGELPPFKKELELNEKAEMVHWYDYALYKLFGIDRYGYFTLKAEKDWYQLHPWGLLDQDSDEYSDDFGDINESVTSEVDAFEPGDEIFHGFLHRSDSGSVMSLDRYLS
ncbi:Isc10p Ecym_3504 [Eremothecium cymbalariae DBVPG|uniref:Uncharacterized protein n=1 Tax=Eremothecium cymbalariae (strain CBS 270.75 / DBVPG 7215 / KCTC 17166 / NRRL Y-17582) TaxID=931890 RepID=G8JS63_ERECY|nr:Hypothetical protein Ecym_3504 [Eremothecium cymbalariae DBVPG\